MNGTLNCPNLSAPWHKIEKLQRSNLSSDVFGFDSFLAMLWADKLPRRDLKLTTLEKLCT